MAEDLGPAQRQHFATQSVIRGELALLACALVEITAQRGAGSGDSNAVGRWSQAGKAPGVSVPQAPSRLIHRHASVIEAVLDRRRNSESHKKYSEHHQMTPCISADSCGVSCG